MELTKTHKKFATLTDKEVITRVLDGDQHIFELIMRRYNQKLFRLARSILRDADEAEDTLQDAYTLAYTHLHSFRGDSLGPWLAKITTNAALARLRKNQQMHLINNSGYFEKEETMQMDDYPSYNTTFQPESATNTHKILGLLETAIDRLPKDYRMVFVLRAVEQLSVDETAQYLDIKSATVKTRYHRAKSLLQTHLNCKIEAIAGEIFTFGGERCDRIIDVVFEKIPKQQERTYVT